MNFEISKKEAERELEGILKPKMALQMLNILKGRLEDVNTDPDKIELLYDNPIAERRTPRNVKEKIIDPYIKENITRQEASERASEALIEYKEACMEKGYTNLPLLFFSPE